jgi:hypothetical protein
MPPALRKTRFCLPDGVTGSTSREQTALINHGPCQDSAAKVSSRTSNAADETLEKRFCK